MKLSEINESSELQTFLCDWILCNGASVGKTKREILAQIASNDPQYEIPYERCRLRKKSTYGPNKIYLDDQIFGDDIILLSNYEVCLEYTINFKFNVYERNPFRKFSDFFARDR